MNLTQKEVAEKSTERLSVFVKIEQGEFIPSVPTARKLEKVLGVRLIGSSDNSGEMKKQAAKPERSSAGMTLGDLIKRKS